MIARKLLTALVVAADRSIAAAEHSVEC